MFDKFVNLHSHSEFSALDGFARFDDVTNEDGEIVVQGITSKLKELGQSRFALTDHGTLSGIQPAYTSLSKSGIQLLPGCEFYVVEDVTQQQKQFQNHLVVIAKNKKGWENILKMNFISFEKGSRMIFDRIVGRINLKTLAEHSEGLVISSACLAGVPTWDIKNGEFKKAEEHVKLMKKLFPDSYFLEVQCVEYYHRLDQNSEELEVDKQWIERQAKDQKHANDRIVDLADKLKVPVVITLDSHYVNREDRDSHLLLLAVQSKTSIITPAFAATGGSGRLAFEATPMMSSDEMIKILTEKESGFNGYDKGQVEDWINNTEIAANLCETPKYLDPTGYKIPLFPVEQAKDYQKFLKWQSMLDPEVKSKILSDSEEFLKTRIKG